MCLFIHSVCFQDHHLLCCIVSLHHHPFFLPLLLCSLHLVHAPFVMKAYGQREATERRRRRLPCSRVYVHVPVLIRRRASLRPPISLFMCVTVPFSSSSWCTFWGGCLFVSSLALFAGGAKFSFSLRHGCASRFVSDVKDPLRCMARRNRLSFWRSAPPPTHTHMCFLFTPSLSVDLCMPVYTPVSMA